MIKRLRKKMQNGGKAEDGFTLVELIVVLVILSILASIAIPSMTSWIRQAKENQVIMEARTVYLAAQTVASERYGMDGESLDAPDDAMIESIMELCGLEGREVQVRFEMEEGTIINFEFSAHDLTVVYDQTESAWVIQP